VPGRRLVVRTRTPGFTAEVYGAAEGPPDDVDDWERLAANARVDDGERIALDVDGADPRYYLLWITSLPRARRDVRVSELGLIARR
jgi:hypothetical protein